MIYVIGSELLNAVDYINGKYVSVRVSQPLVSHLELYIRNMFRLYKYLIMQTALNLHLFQLINYEKMYLL